MKRFIIAYIGFACTFLFFYSLKSRYEGDQVGTFIKTVPFSEAPSRCTSAGRVYASLYERKDKSTYYLCSTRYSKYTFHTNVEHYTSPNERFFRALFGAFVVGLVVFYFKPFVHYLNTN